MVHCIQSKEDAAAGLVQDILHSAEDLDIGSTANGGGSVGHLAEWRPILPSWHLAVLCLVPHHASSDHILG